MLPLPPTTTTTTTIRLKICRTSVLVTLYAITLTFLRPMDACFTSVPTSSRSDHQYPGTTTTTTTTSLSTFSPEDQSNSWLWRAGDGQFDQTTEYTASVWKDFYERYLKEEYNFIHYHSTIFWLSIVYCKELVRFDSKFGRCKVTGYDPDMSSFGSQKVFKEKYDYFLDYYNKPVPGNKVYNLRGMIFALRLMVAGLYRKAVGKKPGVGINFDRTCNETRYGSKVRPELADGKTSSQDMWIYVTRCYTNVTLVYPNWG